MNKFEDDLWLERCEVCGSVVDVSEVRENGDNVVMCMDCIGEGE